MKKANIVKIIEAMEESARIIANDNNVSERIKLRNEGYASAYATILLLLTNDKYAKEVAEIYEVEI